MVYAKKAICGHLNEKEVLKLYALASSSMTELLCLSAETCSRETVGLVIKYF